jgi:hypothetical protein
VTDFCDVHCPFLGCASCAYAGGEIPTVATVSDARTGVADGSIEPSAPSASDPRDAANVRGRGPTGLESNKMDRTPKPPPVAAL